MIRNEAYQILTKYITNKNLLKHCYAAEAGMRGIYQYLYKNKSSYAKATEDKWGITGLLHDIDYQIAQETNKLDKHGTLLFETNPELLPDDITYAIKSHNFEGTKVEPKSDMDWAIAIVDGLTGFIVSCTLIHPDKKLASITPEFVLKRLGQPAFSRNVRRDIIKLCEPKLGISLAEFVAITLKSMQGISDELGL
ncbi:MAG TPA: phosphohydrolase [Patescibacteria group bacterium]|nr:phosphohydrolase [Patescibacteria group bacterium]